MARLYAHRGAAIECPENTLESFERAWSLGVTGLELDVHMTADQRVVVSHDPSGARMCNVDNSFRHSTWSEVKNWDAGWGFVDAQGKRPFANRGLRVPLLAGIVDAFPNALLNVDLKQFFPSMVPQVIKILRDAGAEERVTLASFSQSTLLQLRACGYRGPTAMGAAELALALTLPPRLLRRAPFLGQSAQIPVRQGPLRLDGRGTIERLHKLGARVDYWTINDPRQAEELLHRGADGIMTDDPRAILPVFEKLHKLN